MKKTSGFLGSLLLASVITLSLLLGCNTGGGGGEIDDGGGDSPDAKSILSSLGVADVANPPAQELTSTIGVTSTPSSEWQPLRKDYAVFTPKAEVFSLGLSKDGTVFNYYNEDGVAGYATTSPLTDDQAWEKDCAKATCAADLDGDAIDEIAILYTPTNGGSGLDAIVYDDGSFTKAEKVAGINLGTENFLREGGWNTTISTSHATEYIYDRLAACPADLDGDGKDELLLYAGKTAWALELGVSGSSSIIGTKTYEEDISDIAAGDCDGDGEAEFAVCLVTQGFALYDSSFDSALTNPAIYTLSGSQQGSEAAFGDFNGDNIDELCVSYSTSSEVTAKLYSASGDSLDLRQTLTASSLPFNIFVYKAFPRAVDIDGDGLDELLFMYKLYKNVLSRSDSTIDVYSSDHAGSFNYYYTVRDVEVADVDGDAKQDLVVMGVNYGMWAAIYAMGYNSTNSAVTVKPNAANPQSYLNANTDKTPMFATYNNYIPLSSAAIVAGNFDDDSDRVRYAGHQLEFTEPIVIAALASPPYWKDVADKEPTYSYTNWVTSYGTSSGSSSSSGTSVGFSVGLSMEFEQEGSIFGIKLAKFKASASFKASVDSAYDTTSTFAESRAFSCVGGEDRVVFTAVPQDSYSYVVLRSASSSDIGKTLTISLPRRPDIYSVDRAFYNDHNGGLADIDAAVFGHKLGDPKSYPTLGQRDDLLEAYPGYSSSSAVSVNEYNPATTTGGSVEFQLEAEEEKSTTFSWDTAMDTSIGGGAGGFTVALDLGFHAGCSYTTTVSQGTIFTGTVGNLPESYFNNPNYGYSEGLFAYSYSSSAWPKPFWVVNYWVEY